MIEGLKPYEAYRKAELMSVGCIPTHWSEVRAKTLLREVDDRSATGKEELLSVSHISGIRKRAELNATMFLAKSNAGHKLCRPGDLVINTMWAWMGALGFSMHEGLVSPAYGVYRGRGARDFAPFYLHHLLRTPAYVAEYTNRSTGIHSSRLRLYPEQFLRMHLLLPPADEQAAIVRFIDHANRRIDRYIRAKRKLIALLNQQKQAIIYRAVTRGLEPNVPMKNSGVSWLGEIPEHWEVRKVKHMVRTVGGMTPAKNIANYWTGCVPWVSPKDMKVRVVEDSRDHISDLALRKTGIELIASPAVLIVVRGMILARTFPTAITAVPVTVNQDMKALLPRKNVDASFLALLFSGIERDVLKLVEESGHGTRCLRTDAWANMLLPLPPLTEQVRIAEQINVLLSGANQALRAEETQVSLLREYRNRLIADVVTGQLDVREAAARLPAEEPEPLDDPAELEDDELAADDADMDAA